MPVGICVRCRKPCPDSFHNFNEVCECIDWKKRAKEKGYKLKFPKKKEGLK